MVLLFGYMLVSLAFQTARPWGDRLPAIVTVGLCAAAVLWFFRRQWRAVQTADALLTGSSINLIDGRRALLDAELYTWESRAARSIELLVGPGAILGAGVLWWLGRVPPWLPLAMALTLASVSAYGRLRRIPWLRGEIAKLEKLARALA